MSTKLCPNKLQESLRTKVLGKTIFFSREIGSTNDWAKELANLGASEGTVVIAETQTRGRGRINRKWTSPTGGLWFSVVLRPKLSPREATKLTFIASLAVAETLRELYSLKTETKWPNDVIVNGRKICGVLSEMSTSDEKLDYVVVGIGVNANFNVERSLPPSIRPTATSLQEKLGRKVRLEELFKSLLEKMESIYTPCMEKGFDTLLKEWKTYAGFLGQQVEVVDQNERMSGLACDVDKEGALILRLENGTLRSLFVGDLSLRTRQNGRA